MTITREQINLARKASDRLKSLTFEVEKERFRQLRKWGPQTHPSGTGPDQIMAGRSMAFYAKMMKNWNDRQVEPGGQPHWSAILLEEVFEAMEADNYGDLRTELIQSMAVIAAWIEDIDDRKVL